MGERVSVFANTDEPIMAKTIFTPTLRRNVLLPAILEPVIRFIWFTPSVEKLFLTNFSTGIIGWPKSSAVKTPSFSLKRGNEFSG